MEKNVEHAFFVLYDIKSGKYNPANFTEGGYYIHPLTGLSASYVDQVKMWENKKDDDLRKGFTYTIISHHDHTIASTFTYQDFFALEDMYKLINGWEKDRNEKNVPFYYTMQSFNYHNNKRYIDVIEINDFEKFKYRWNSEQGQNILDEMNSKIDVLNDIKKANAKGANMPWISEYIQKKEYEVSQKTYEKLFPKSFTGAGYYKNIGIKNK